jgi:hypothetical protein
MTIQNWEQAADEKTDKINDILKIRHSRLESNESGLEAFGDSSETVVNDKDTNIRCQKIDVSFATITVNGCENIFDNIEIKVNHQDLDKSSLDSNSNGHEDIGKKLEMIADNLNITAKNHRINDSLVEHLLLSQDNKDQVLTKPVKESQGSPQSTPDHDSHIVPVPVTNLPAIIAVSPEVLIPSNTFLPFASSHQLVKSPGMNEVSYPDQLTSSPVESLAQITPTQDVTSPFPNQVAATQGLFLDHDLDLSHEAVPAPLLTSDVIPPPLTPSSGLTLSKLNMPQGLASESLTLIPEGLPISLNISTENILNPLAHSPDAQTVSSAPAQDLTPVPLAVSPHVTSAPLALNADLNSAFFVHSSVLTPASIALSPDEGLAFLSLSSDLTPSPMTASPDLTPALLAPSLDVTPALLSSSLDVTPALLAPSSDVTQVPLSSSFDVTPALLAPSSEVTQAPIASSLDVTPSPLAPSSEVTPTPLPSSIDVPPAPLAPSSEVTPTPLPSSIDVTPAPLAPSSEVTPTPLPSLNQASSVLCPAKDADVSSLDSDTIPDPLTISPDVTPALLTLDPDVTPSPRPSSPLQDSCLPLFVTDLISVSDMTPDLVTTQSDQISPRCTSTSSVVKIAPLDSDSFLELNVNNQESRAHTTMNGSASTTKTDKEADNSSGSQSEGSPPPDLEDGGASGGENQNSGPNTLRRRSRKNSQKNKKRRRSKIYNF